MANEYQNFPELAADEARLMRRRKIAEMMQQQAIDPIKQQTAGGYVVPTHGLEAIAKIMQGYMGRKDAEGADADQLAIAEKAAGIQGAERQKIVDAITKTEAKPFEQNIMEGEELPIQGLVGQSARNQTPQDQLGSLIQASGSVRSTNNQKFVDTQQKHLENTIAREDAQQARLDAAKAGKADAPEPRPFLVTDNAGNSKIVDVKGNVVKDLGQVGKPTGSFEKAAIAKKKLGTDLDTVIKELENATKDNGLIDQSTGSGAGALVDMGAGFFGKSTPGAIAVGQLKPIYDLALKMVPRFEGPQSDKDTASYEKAAGQLANPSIPNDIKKIAGREILRLMKLRKSQFFDKTAEVSGDSNAGEWSDL